MQMSFFQSGSCEAPKIKKPTAEYTPRALESPLIIVVRREQEAAMERDPSNEAAGARQA